MITGHALVVATLEASLPAVTLLLGPESVGKRTLAEHLARHHRVLPADCRVLPAPLTVDAVRRVTAFANTAPFGAIKLVLARLDGASEPAQHALLKILEEPPPSTRFILTAVRRPLPTIFSRCWTYHLRHLDVTELATILTEHGMSPAAARTAAALGRGRVRTAMAASSIEAVRLTVLTTMRAVAGSDPVGFDKAFKSFDDDAYELLIRWLTEAITGQYVVFAPADFFGMHRDQRLLRQLLVALSQHPHARTRLATRAALEPFVART